MKQFILFICLIAACFANNFAQNWQPFVSGDAYHYKVLGTSLILETIVTDSLRFVNGDSVFYFNEQVQKCDNCPSNNSSDSIFIRRLPHFLGKQMIKKTNGEYLLEGTNTYHLFPASVTGAIWQFSPTLMATVTNISLRNIWGSMDSVKTILLSNNDSILLSQNYGLLQFPALSPAPAYILAGIPSRNIGENVANTSSIYDFNVGDIFFYQNEFSQFGSGIYFSTVEEKWEVTQKQLYTDSVTYTFYIHGVRHSSSTGTSYYTKTQISTIKTSLNSFADSYNGISAANTYIPTMVSPYNLYLDGWSQSAAILYRSSDSSQNNTKKMFTGGEQLNDTLTIISDYRIIVWQNGLGETFSEASMLEAHTLINQVGYIKNGIAVGKVFENWYYTDVADRESNRFSLYPNPTQDKLTLSCNQALGTIKSFAINDLVGKTMLSTIPFQYNSSYEISVKDWAQGIYFIEVRDEKGNTYTQKFRKD